MFPTLPRFAWGALVALLLVGSLAIAETGQAPDQAAPTPKDWEATLNRADAYVRAARPDSVSQVEHRQETAFDDPVEQLFGEFLQGHPLRQVAGGQAHLDDDA